MTPSLYLCSNVNGFTTNKVLELIMTEPFILAKQATQVFYIEDPKDSRKHIVMHSKRRILGDNVVDEEEYDQFDELPPFSLGIPSSNDDVDDTTYLRSDHHEGLYENSVEARVKTKSYFGTPAFPFLSYASRFSGSVRT
ncbi:hypothetical protein LXL04_022965 [Taraxacum kok-saghyz]